MTRNDWRLCFVLHQWPIVMSANDVPTHSLQVHADRPRALHMNIADNKWFRPYSMNKTAKERIHAWCHNAGFDSIIGQTQFEGWHLWFQLVIRSVLPQRMSILG
eukprot:UN4696